MNEPRAGAPVAEVGINSIALRRSVDVKHHIRFRWRQGHTEWTLAELDRRATRVAHRLRSLGFRPRDRIGIMSLNRIEWVLLDLAILKLGAVTAGFEARRFSSEQVVRAYGLCALFTDGHVTAGPVFDIGNVLSWSEDPDTTADHLALHAGYDPADILAIKFTSGSTGVPKGLEATVASVDSSLAAVQGMFEHGDGDNLLVFLRLALLQQRYWIYSAILNGHDVTISDQDYVLETARATSPTVVMGVPGFYESLRTQLLEAQPRAEAHERGHAIQVALGGKIRYLWTGSAPCGRAVLDFFNEAGVPLYEGYGLNETCIVAKNHPGAYRSGSVGRVLPGKSVRFDRDGILIVASRHPVNCRYTWCGEGVNEKTFLPSGEVKTWDLGHVDDDGFLYIAGRVDDVLTLSGGRNVLVRLIEERLREHPSVHECVLAGNGRPFLSAIVSPAASPTNAESLVHHVQQLNMNVLPEQRVYALVLADEKFSVENGLLTSQFKPRRKDIYLRHAQTLARLYEAAGPAAPDDATALRFVRESSITIQPSFKGPRA